MRDANDVRQLITSAGESIAELDIPSRASLEVEAVWQALVAAGYVEKKKIERTNFYINRPLFTRLTQISL